jgi:hypothetical protein
MNLNLFAKNYIMENEQSYNHFMPQSIIKRGWGYTLDEKSYINVLNYKKLRKFLDKKLILNLPDLNRAMYNDYGCLEQSHNIVTRRNTTRIMGNRLIYNLTEKNLGYIGHDIQLDIEKVMLDSIVNNDLGLNAKNILHKWFALQKARAWPEFVHFHDIFLFKENISAIENKNQYLLFKKHYNRRAQEYYNEYLSGYTQNKFQHIVVEAPFDTFLFLGETNTLNAANLVKSILAHNDSLVANNIHMLPKHYGLLHCIDISIISSQKLILLCHPIITREEIYIISSAIFYSWNYYQTLYESNILVVPEKSPNKYIDNFNTIILEQKNSFLLNHNLNFFNKYREFLTLSDTFEKQ